MTPETPRPPRSARAAAASRSGEKMPGERRPAEVAREMRERAETSMAYENGVVLPVEGGPAVEESPYEKLFTGGDTVIPKPQPLHVDTAKVILLGTAAWAVMLVLTLLVPALHHGSRHWWPWMCVAGVVLGMLGWAYVRRGRGNAEAA